MKGKNENERPEAYPKPTGTDTQMKNQDEFTERKSSTHSDNLPANGGKPQKGAADSVRPEQRDIL